ncbi:hypothetical protein [Pedobacter aquatilis]|uniref:hypothetical protein n=1 Tax=Pedobacter aquatilis TaxID=351343 RepID=UPI00292F3627|nr:hypothetical protein [Pedobacter aquatilis]
MENILNDADYKLALRRIELLLSKGSQRIISAEIHEITLLRAKARDYEVIRYDYSRISEISVNQ